MKYFYAGAVKKALPRKTQILSGNRKGLRFWASRLWITF
jgi:hypothetical protein